MGTETQDAVVELDADLHVARLAHGIDPERLLDVIADLVGERTIEQIEERLPLRSRQISRRHYGQGEAELVVGERDQLRVVVREGVCLVEFDDGRQVAGRGFGQPPRHLVPSAAP